MDYIAQKEYDSNLHDGWKRFGDFYFENKKALLKFLASKRVSKKSPTPDSNPELFQNPTGTSHYIGNPNIKSGFQNLEYTKEQLIEYKKCMEDPVYFNVNVNFNVFQLTARKPKNF